MHKKLADQVYPRLCYLRPLFINDVSPTISDMKADHITVLITPATNVFHTSSQEPTNQFHSKTFCLVVQIRHIKCLKCK